MEKLHYHVLVGNYSDVQALLKKGVDPNEKNSDGRTPLMIAARNSYKELVELLINSGADIHCHDINGSNVLHYASLQGSVDIIQCLVNKGVDLNVKCTFGQTPLHISAIMQKIEIAEYLLKSGADCNLEDNKGDSPFSILIRAKEPNVEIIKLCIEKGAYVKPIDCTYLFECPLLKEDILQDVILCSRLVINKFNNKDLPLLYEALASLQKLPHVDEMKIGKESEMFLVIARAISRDIMTNCGFCNLIGVYYELGIVCVKFSIEKSNTAIDQTNPSESSNRKSYYSFRPSDSICSLIWFLFVLFVYVCNVTVILHIVLKRAFNAV